MTTQTLSQVLTNRTSYNDLLAIVVSRSRCQKLFSSWQDKNMPMGGELLETELLEYARALSKLPEDVWPAGKHSPELQEAIEGFQQEVNMLTDSVTALYGEPIDVPE